MDKMVKPTTEEVFSLLATKIGSSNFELISHEFQTPDEKIGLLGDHATITTIVNIFTDKNDKPGSSAYAKNIKTFTFFAKLFPSSEVQAIFCKGTGAFKKEIFMYEIFNKIRQSGVQFIDCVPNCYFSKDNYALVTDNLAEKGYKLVDKRETLDFETILIVTKALAKLHASTVIFEENESKRLGKNYSLLDDYEANFEESLYNDKKDFVNLKGVEATIKGILSEIDIFKCPEKLKSGKDFKTVAKRACFEVYNLVKRTTTCRNVICHGDLWATNFLVKYDGNGKPADCKLVDFQFGRYLAPSHDVMSVLYLTTSREFRKKHMYEVIGVYYANLEKFLKLAGLNIAEIFPFDIFMKSCEQQKLFAIFQSASYFQFVLLDNKLLEEFFDDSEYSTNTLSDDRTPFILANVVKDEIYRKRLEDSILDLEEYCDYL